MPQRSKVNPKRFLLGIYRPNAAKVKGQSEKPTCPAHVHERGALRHSRYTVEPPNKGHFGNGQFVLFSEAVPISEVCHCLTI